ncbi:MAG: DUF1203 domain-containing protein [Saprospiraceae bacterium]
MNIQFQIKAIEDVSLNHFFDLSEEELKDINAVKMIVNEKPGFPCRVSLEDANIGEEVILFPFAHHKVNSPYQSSGPIFIRKNARIAQLEINEIPIMLKHRLLSLRIYDGEGMMIDGLTVEGKTLGKEIENVFENESAKYIQIHNASPGCYNCQVDRVD